MVVLAEPKVLGAAMVTDPVRGVTHIALRSSKARSRQGLGRKWSFPGPGSVEALVVELVRPNSPLANSVIGMAKGAPCEFHGVLLYVALLRIGVRPLSTEWHDGKLKTMRLRQNILFK